MNSKERSLRAEKLLTNAESLLVVRNKLMTAEQVAYCMGWHERFGDQETVVDNAIGPAIADILYLTNSSNIIGVDEIGFWNNHTFEYVAKYWDWIDCKPIYPAGAFGYFWGETAENIEIDDTEWSLFWNHQKDRRKRGYWDGGAVNRWGIDRLLMIELKKLGVDPKTISLFPYDHPEMVNVFGDEFTEGWSGMTEICFEWAFPGEKLKPRRLLYLSTTLDRVPEEIVTGEMLEVNFFHQKSLPDYELTPAYLKLVLPLLSDSAVVAVGKVFNYQDNRQYKEEIQTVLGSEFSAQQADPDLEVAIDRILLEDDKDEEMFDSKSYGMKLHVFSKGY